jgi:large subunit ribosomal protein L10
MNRDQKAAVVDEIAAEIGSAEAIFAVDYRGITVAQVADLRTKLRAVDARFRVVKNSLSERAADKAGAENLKPMLVGPTALTLVRGDAALAAKALSDAARQFNLLEFKGGLLNGVVMSADQVRAISRLPSRQVLQSQLVGTIAAPLTGLARGLNGLIAGIAIQLKAIADMDPPVLVRGTPPAPVAEAPVADAPVAEAPVADAPVAEGAVAEGAVAEGAVAEGAVAEGAVAEGAVAEAAVAEGAVAEGAVAEGAVAEGAVAEGAVAEPEAAVGEPEAEAAEPDPTPEPEPEPEPTSEPEAAAASDAEPSDDKEEA